MTALRGRPRGAPDAVWATWEVYVKQFGDRSAPGMPRSLAEVLGSDSMTSAQARAIVREYETRVPGYEFKVVRARLVEREEALS